MRYNVRVENLFTGLRAALFDLDGTLVETHIDFDLMKREVLRFSAARGIDTHGLGLLDILSIVEHGHGSLASSGHARDAASFRECAFALLEEIEVAHCAAPLEILGAAQLLRELDSRGIAVGIVTRNCRTVALRLVEFASLTHHALLTRDDVPRTKLDPSHLLAALSALGIDFTTPGAQHPTPCLMTGDHWMDVQAGRAAGMRTVGILRGKRPESFAPAMPDLLVGELAELLTLAKAA